MRGGVPDRRVRSSIEDDACPLVGGWGGGRFFSFVGILLARGKFGANDRPQDGNNVVCLSDRSRALLDQAVGAFGARIERRARHGKDFAALFQREPRRDQRARMFGSFDNDQAKGEARNQPIAARKVWRPRFPSEWHFSQSQPGGQDVIKEIGMFGGINAILAAGENCDGSGCKAGAMRRGIDAAR